MNRRRALLGPLLLACACGDASDASPPDYDASVDSGPTTATLVLSSACSLEPVVGDPICFKAYVSGAEGVVAFDWRVKSPQNQDVAAEEVGSQVSFTAKETGTYTVSCEATVEGLPDQLDETLKVTVAGEYKLWYTARLFPTPEHGIPPLDITFAVTDAGLEGAVWTLPDTNKLTVTVKDGAAQGVPSFLRVMQTPNDPIPRQVYLPSGTGTIRLAGKPYALVVPEQAPIAPRVETVDSTSASFDVVLDDPGRRVSGKILRGVQAVPGAIVALRTRDVTGIAVPSTVGESAADGSYELFVREGQGSLTITPPPQSGLPVALVSDPQLAVSGDASWDFRYRVLDTIELQGSVTSSDGGKVVGARVRLVSEGLADVGTLERGGGDLSAAGVFRRELITVAGGQLLDPTNMQTKIKVPKGSYRFEVSAPAQLDREGWTVVKTTLDQPRDLEIQLMPKARVQGVVEDERGVPVEAVVEVRSALGIRTTASDASGAFDLLLDRDVDYSFVVRPLPSYRDLGVLLMPKVTVVEDQQLSKLTLPRAVSISGVVKKNNAKVDGILIRVWCSGAGCPSTQLVDEVRTSGGGKFELKVPRPGAKGSDGSQ